MKRHNSFWPTTLSELENPIFVSMACPGALMILFGNFLISRDQIALLIFGIVLGPILGIMHFRHTRKRELIAHKPLILNFDGKQWEFSKSEIASHDVDPQNGFTPLCPDELPVPEGDQIVTELNAQAKFSLTRTCSKDAHSPNAYHIASAEMPQFTPITSFPDLDMFWNRHCQSGTYGGRLLNGLPEILDYDFVVYKGIESELHPYGGCYHDTHKRLSTGLIEFYKQNDIKLVIVGGLATDYCVLQTVLQLIDAGFYVVINMAACRGVAPETTEAALQTMARAGAILISNGEILENLKYKG